MTNPDSSSRDTPHSHTVYTYILDTHTKGASAPGWRRHNDTYLRTTRKRNQVVRWTIQGCEAGNGNSAAAAVVVVAVDTVKRPSGSIIRLYV